MVVFGAIDFAAAVARVGAFLGYRVTVCDARPVFATPKRFPEAHEVVVEWPHRYLQAEVDAGRIDERTVLCVLTHDPKFDVPLLEVALRIPVAYVGAMGSRRTHEEREARLREAGLTTAEIARLSSPIGLDLGARTPEETAVSIAAEIIAGRWGGSGRAAGRHRGADPPHRRALSPRPTRSATGRHRGGRRLSDGGRSGRAQHQEVRTMPAVPRPRSTAPPATSSSSCAATTPGRSPSSPGRDLGRPFNWAVDWFDAIARDNDGAPRCGSSRRTAREATVHLRRDGPPLGPGGRLAARRTASAAATAWC